MIVLIINAFITHFPCYQNISFQVSEMVWLVKVLMAENEDPTLISGPDIVEREN